MIISFSKYHGTGNDFVVIDGRNVSFSTAMLPVSDFCNRRTGIGADGLIMLLPSEKADFRMLYFNADGQQASMCGNGGRVVTAFAHKLGLIAGSACFEASDGLHRAGIQTTGAHRSFVRLSMIDVEKVSYEPEGIRLNTGVPHLVVFTNELTSMNVVEQGSRLRNLAKFQPEGTNVNFAEIIDEGLMVRTYERGVEDETLSCGTGITASVLAYALKNQVQGGETQVLCKGGNLSVSFRREDEKFTDIMLNGPVVHVFDGTIEI